MPLIISVISRKKDCKEQKLHRVGDNVYFFIIPIMENFEIGILPSSHNNPFPELCPEINGKLQEFPAKMYQFKNILFVARRNLVHSSGHAI